MKKCVVCILCASVSILFWACTHHMIEVAPVEIKPIHITIDVNVKIDKALDDFFGDIDQKAKTTEPRTVK
jgi:hypothetical protein